MSNRTQRKIVGEWESIGRSMEEIHQKLRHLKKNKTIRGFRSTPYAAEQTERQNK